MSRKAVQLICTKEELDVLNKLANERKIQKRVVERAKIILFCHEGLRNDQISEKVHTTVMTVAKWRNRFAKYRIEGLNDKVRSGKPRKYDESIRNDILKLIEQPAPLGKSRWDGEAIAKHLRISHDIVWRILRKEGVQLQRIRMQVG